MAFLPARKRDHHPALISAFGLCDEIEPGIIATPHDVVAIHLTLLKPDGTDKAEIRKPKLIIASPGGSPIVLAPLNDLLGLAITEGIEDALTAHETTGLGAWAAGSAGMMPGLADAVPNYTNNVTIYADENKAGRENADRLAERLKARGIYAEIIPSGAMP